MFCVHVLAFCCQWMRELNNSTHEFVSKLYSWGTLLQRVELRSQKMRITRRTDKSTVFKRDSLKRFFYLWFFCDWTYLVHWFIYSSCFDSFNFEFAEIFEIKYHSAQWPKVQNKLFSMLGWISSMDGIDLAYRAVYNCTIFCLSISFNVGTSFKESSCVSVLCP